MFFLASVRISHFWTQVYPGLEFEPDIEAILREHEALAEPILHGVDDAVRWELGRLLYDELESLREQQKRIEAMRKSETRFRGIEYRIRLIDFLLLSAFVQALMTYISDSNACAI
jgi:hypothetical protein